MSKSPITKIQFTVLRKAWKVLAGFSLMADMPSPNSVIATLCESGAMLAMFQAVSATSPETVEATLAKLVADTEAAEAEAEAAKAATEAATEAQAAS